MPRLTYSQLLSEDSPLPQGGAIPPAVAKLVLTLIDAQLGALPHHDDGIRAALADGPLTRGQPRDLVADDVSAQSYHRGQRPMGGRDGRGERGR